MLFKCPWCDYTHSDVKNSLRVHVSKRHKKSSEELKRELGIIKEVAPLCACGCGEFVKLNKTGNFNTYIIGHHNRIKNNWGHNKNALEKSLETRRREGKFGNWGWNAGLTKHTDERLRLMGENIKEKYGEKYSKNMSKNRLSGVIPTLNGSSHPQWKGGSSSISELCHGSSKLYKLWKFPALQRAFFKCEVCSETRNLHVHHSEIKMSEIIKLCAPENAAKQEFSFEEKAVWAQNVVNWHIVYNIPSKVLCYVCHSKEHPKLNFKH